MTQATRTTALAIVLLGAALGALTCAILLNFVAAPAWLSNQDLGAWVIAYTVILVVSEDPSRRDGSDRSARSMTSGPSATDCA